MARTPTYNTGDEPIDGYRLVDFLGAGQFGEVWKAVELQSGRLSAIKFIDLTHSPSALKEVKAFNLIRNLNHPNLVPIYTARLHDQQNRLVSFDDVLDPAKQRQRQLKDLVIVMGLAEKSLAGRLKEFNPDGTPPEQMRGLPADELLEYLEGAARGIDYLNRPDHALGVGDGPIVHCDIKPDNLMVVSGQVQVADCGVAVVVTADVRKTQAAGSPAYSPIELTLNKPGPYTDQYSLAVSYFELRTGRLPFPDGVSAMEVMIRHQQGQLDFSDPQVGPAERRVLRFATAPRAEQRFPSCADFVRQMRRAVEGSSVMSPADLVRAKSSASDPNTRPGSSPLTRRPPSDAVRDLPAGRAGSVVDFDAGLPDTDHGAGFISPEPFDMFPTNSVDEITVDNRQIGESGIVDKSRQMRRPAAQRPGGLIETAMPTAEEREALLRTPGRSEAMLGETNREGTALLPASPLKKWLLAGGGAAVLAVGGVGAVAFWPKPPVVEPTAPEKQVAGFNPKDAGLALAGILSEPTVAKFEEGVGFIDEKHQLGTQEATDWAKSARVEKLPAAAEKVVLHAPNWSGPDAFAPMRKFLDELAARDYLTPAAASLRGGHLKPAAQKHLDGLLSAETPEAFAVGQRFVTEATAPDYARSWDADLRPTLSRAADKVVERLTALLPPDQLTEAAAEDAGTRFEDARRFVKANEKVFTGGPAAVLNEVDARGTRFVEPLLKGTSAQNQMAGLFLYKQGRTGWRAKQLEQVEARSNQLKDPFVPATALAKVNEAIKVGAADGNPTEFVGIRTFITAQRSRGADPKWVTEQLDRVNAEAARRLAADLDSKALTAKPLESLAAARRFVSVQRSADPAGAAPANWLKQADADIESAAAGYFAGLLPPPSTDLPTAGKQLLAAKEAAAKLSAEPISIKLDAGAKLRSAAEQVLTARLAAPPPTAEPVEPLTNFVTAARRLVSDMPDDADGKWREARSGQIDTAAAGLLNKLLARPGEPAKVLDAGHQFAVAAGTGSMRWKPLAEKEFQVATRKAVDALLPQPTAAGADAARAIDAAFVLVYGPDNKRPVWTSSIDVDDLYRLRDQVRDAANARRDLYKTRPGDARFEDARAYVTGRTRSDDPERLMSWKASAKRDIDADALAALTALLADPKTPVDPAVRGTEFIAAQATAPDPWKQDARQQVAQKAAAYTESTLLAGLDFDKLTAADIDKARKYLEQHKALGFEDRVKPKLAVADATVSFKGLVGQGTRAAEKDAQAMLAQKETDAAFEDWLPKARAWEPFRTLAAEIRAVFGELDAKIAACKKDPKPELLTAVETHYQKVRGGKYPKHAKELEGYETTELVSLRKVVRNREVVDTFKPLKETVDPAKLDAALVRFKADAEQREVAVQQAVQLGKDKPDWRMPLIRSLVRADLLAQPTEDDRKQIATFWVEGIQQTSGKAAKEKLAALATDRTPAAKAAAVEAAQKWAADRKEAAGKLAEFAALKPSTEDERIDQTVTVWQAAVGDPAKLTEFRQLLTEKDRCAFPSAMWREFYDAAATHRPETLIADLRAVRDVLTGDDQKQANARFQPELSRAVQALVGPGPADAKTVKELVKSDVSANDWAKAALAEAEKAAPPTVPSDADAELSGYVKYLSAVRQADPKAAADELLAVYPKPSEATGPVAAEPRKKAAAEILIATGKGQFRAMWDDGPKVSAAADGLAARFQRAAELTSDARVLGPALLLTDAEAVLARVRQPAALVATRDAFAGLSAAPADDPRLFVACGLKVAATAADPAVRTAATAAVADAYADWVTDEYNAVTRAGLPSVKIRDDRRRDLCRPAIDRLAAAPDAAASPDAARVALARGRLMALSHQSIKPDLEAELTAAQAALDRLGDAATADHLGHTALLAYERFAGGFGFSKDSKYRPPDDGQDPDPRTVAAWSTVFELAERALANSGPADGPEKAAAHRAVGLALIYLSAVPKLSPVHKAAAKGWSVAYTADNDAGWLRLMVPHLSVGIDRSRDVQPELNDYFARSVLFARCSQAILNGQVDRAEARTYLTDTVRRIRRAVEDGLPTGSRFEAYRVMGLAAEDLGWQVSDTGGTEFADAVNTFEKAAAVVDDGPAAATQRLIAAVDLGRCRYRAAAYATAAAAPRDMAAAVKTLTSAVAAAAAVETAVEAKQKASVRAWAAQAQYFLGLAHGAAGDQAAADAELRAVADLADPSPAARVWQDLARLDRGRLAAGRTDLTADASGELAKALRGYADGFDGRENYKPFADTARAYAELLDGKEGAAIERFERLIQSGDRWPVEYRRANAEYQFALSELLRRWADTNGKFDPAQRKAAAVAFKVAVQAAPWVLPAKIRRDAEAAADRLTR